MKPSASQIQKINYEELSLSQISLISGIEEATLKELDCEALIIKPLQQLGKHKNEAQKQLKQLKEGLDIQMRIKRKSNLLNDISDFQKETDEDEKKDIHKDIIKALKSEKTKIDEIVQKMEAMKNNLLLNSSQSKENVSFLQKCIHTFIQHLSAFSAKVTSSIHSKSDKIHAIKQSMNSTEHEMNSLPNLQKQRDDLQRQIERLYSELKTYNNDKLENQLKKQQCHAQIKKNSLLIHESQKKILLNENEIERLQFIHGSDLNEKPSDDQSKKIEDKYKIIQPKFNGNYQQNQDIVYKKEIQIKTKQQCHAQIKKNSLSIEENQKELLLKENEMQKLQLIHGSDLKMNASVDQSKKFDDFYKFTYSKLYGNNNQNEDIFNKNQIQIKDEKAKENDDDHYYRYKEREEISDLEEQIVLYKENCNSYQQQIKSDQQKLIALEKENIQILNDIANCNDQLEKKSKKQNLLIQEQLEQEKLKLTLRDQKYNSIADQRVIISEKQNLNQDKKNLAQSIYLLEDLVKQIEQNYGNITLNANQIDLDIQIASLQNNSAQLNKYISENIFIEENAKAQISLYEASYKNVQTFLNEFK